MDRQVNSNMLHRITEKMEAAIERHSQMQVGRDKTTKGVLFSESVWNGG